MITMSTFGSNGRLGNQLFQYAAMIGLAKKYNHKLVLPKWKYAEYFQGTFPEGEWTGGRFVQEPVFSYQGNWPTIKENDKVDVKGYFQSRLYWQDAIPEIREALTFKPEFKKQVLDNFVSNYIDENPVEKKTLGISVRRGDYINNPHYAQLPVTYQILAMLERFPDWQERNIIFFSDDIPWCKTHFDCLDNSYFSENNSEIEDLCLLSQMDSFIIPNSTFGWWGVYLAELQRPVKAVRPAHHFDGKLLEQNDIRDLYPLNWDTFNHKDEHGHNKKIDLQDCSFHIPVFRDHVDREENLNLCLKILLKNFDTEILITEQGGRHFENISTDPRVKYIHFPGDVFHRTRMLNQMAQYTTKPYILNWDCDVIISPMQIWLTAQALRKGAEMAYPYEWAFARIPRQTWYTRLRDFEDIGIVGDTKFNGMNHGDAISLGGAVAWNKKYFMEIGGENEQFRSYGCEDVERYERSTKLGVLRERIPGPMFHVNHWVGVNSNMTNPYYNEGRIEYERIKKINEQELREEVKTWPRGL